MVVVLDVRYIARHVEADPAGADALVTVEAMARRVLGVDTFFDWTSDRDPSDDHGST